MSASRIVSSRIIVLVVQISSTSSSVEHVGLGRDPALAQFGGDALPLVAQRQQLPVARRRTTVMSSPCAANAAL